MFDLRYLLNLRGNEFAAFVWPIFSGFINKGFMFSLIGERWYWNFSFDLAGIVQW